MLEILGLAALFFTGNTKGVVQELVNRQPVSDVRLTLDCRKPRPWHGTVSLRTVETVSGKDGSFSFQPADIKGCKYVFVTGSKEGFTDGGQLPAGVSISSGFELVDHVPRFVFMVRNSEIVQMQLDGRFRDSNAVRIAPVGPMPMNDYVTVNVPFYESTRVASTAAQIRWVQGHYCDRLLALWAKVPADEQQKFLDDRISNVVKHPEVLAYCERRP
jgi:hypothetical protein